MRGSRSDVLGPAEVGRVSFAGSTAPDLRRFGPMADDSREARVGSSISELYELVSLDVASGILTRFWKPATGPALRKSSLSTHRLTIVFSLRRDSNGKARLLLRIA